MQFDAVHVFCIVFFLPCEILLRVLAYSCQINLFHARRLRQTPGCGNQLISIDARVVDNDVLKLFGFGTDPSFRDIKIERGATLTVAPHNSVLASDRAANATVAIESHKFSWPERP